MMVCLSSGELQPLKECNHSIIIDGELFQTVSLSEKSKVPPAHALWWSFCAKPANIYI